MEAKELIRNQMRNQRLALSLEDIKAVSSAITKSMQSVIDWSSVSTIHTYQAIAKNREIETYSFLSWLKGKYPNFDIHLQDTTGNFSEEQFDVILVPGLAFDSSGNRIGYGKGMYDKFLATQPNSITIGLAYEFSVLDKLPVEKHDIKLNYIISEKELYN